MRCLRPIAMVLASASMGALSGIIAWVMIRCAAAWEFVRNVHSQEEMAGAAGLGPSQSTLLLLLAVGCVTGAYVGWRSSILRKTNEQYP